MSRPRRLHSQIPHQDRRQLCQSRRWDRGGNSRGQPSNTDWSSARLC